MTSLKLNSILGFTLLCWASAFVGIRIGLDDFSPGALALFRYLIASLVIALFYFRLDKKPQMPLLDKLQMMFLGVLGISIYNLCLNYGEQTVPAGIASFIVGLMPIFTVLLAIVFLRERPAFVVYIGMAVSFLGLGLIGFAEKANATFNGDMLVILISAIMGATYTIMQKRLLNRYHPVVVTCWVIWGGTLALMPFMPAFVKEISTASSTAVVAVVYLGVFPAAIAYLCWGYVLQFLPASQAALYAYATPIISTLLGMLILNERPSHLAFLGGLIALSGAVWASYFRQKTTIPVYKKSPL